MYIRKKQLYTCCLISSIAHAIMTNIYPELAYEQSWDRNNFSIQDGAGLRGTLTFLQNYCIGAIRNETGSVIYGCDKILDIIKEFPDEVICAAKDETLQYLLDVFQGVSVPAITSIFWCNDDNFYWVSENTASLERDFKLLDRLILPAQETIKACAEYYDMDSTALELLRELSTQKNHNFSAPIVLSHSQRRMIPGQTINVECREAFEELNIFLG